MAAVASLALVVGAVLADNAIAQADGPQSPHASRAIAAANAVRDDAKLHLVEAIGETLVEQGTATGTLAGSAHVRVTINAAKDRAAATFTLTLRGGSISGRASGEAHEGAGSRESFSGAILSSHGTGRYARAKLTGTIYGAIERRSDKAEVQVIGSLRN